MEQRSKHNNSDKIARGERAKLLRTSLRLSRPAFVKKSNIPIGSLQCWEDARYGGITKNAANRLIAAYAKEGLVCSIEWLLDGIGPAPLFSQGVTFSIGDHDASKSDIFLPDELIQQELSLFHKHNQNSIDSIISNDALSPFLQKGDLVAGVRYFSQNIKNAVGTISIIQTIDGEVLAGILSANNNNTYDLFNYEQTTIKQFIKLFSAAPIIWIRRQNIIS